MLCILFIFSVFSYIGVVIIVRFIIEVVNILLVMGEVWVKFCVEVIGVLVISFGMSNGIMVKWVICCMWFISVYWFVLLWFLVLVGR